MENNKDLRDENKSRKDINEPCEVIVNKDYTGYNSLTFMLAEKFNKELAHLTFESIKWTISEEFNIDGELYVVNSRIDALEVSNKDGGRYIVYVNDSHCHRIPKVFDLEDFITIYETISKISGKTVAVYQDRIEDAIIIAPAIRL